MNRIRLPTILILLCAVLPLSAEPVKRILVIDSYHAEYAWSHDYREALAETLGPSVRLEFFQMDTKRLPHPMHEVRAREALHRIEADKPDLVITGDDAALKYVGARLAGRALPVVYLGINRNPRDYLPGNPANVTGVLERPLIRRNILIMKQVVPDLKRALVLFDSDLTSEVIREEMFADHGSLRISDVDIDLVMASDFAQWQRLVRDAPGRYQAIWTGLYQTLRDTSGAIVPDARVIEWTAANSPLPLFGFWDFAVGANRAAGGLVLSGHDQGVAAARLAQNILFRHQAPGNLFPVTLGGGVLLFSRAALARHRLVLPSSLQKDSRFVD
ncbi:ABC transporter substrate-binding protein [Paludibacterium paludis]|uniref:Uncharacterized protein n=1 Tax=Paludibacterium paludis TaxID=1225769 RepID=A0A918NYN7_9NEIS|nr:ABC transporter substrate binding protein [Paludibacterium paludis]GGY06695.1 hypothetical protein GCM10011289_06540 [Paludibacterium paludis]